jgi:hypothetical protein
LGVIGYCWGSITSAIRKGVRQRLVLNATYT